MTENLTSPLNKPIALAENVRQSEPGRNIVEGVAQPKEQGNVIEKVD